mmetsp:Transcript_17048/g.29322  ORF Transcript_17048/g.29322 Transcript_17048/m.29322 type:complete len:297 (+) Transcript_17048:1753-2643(+)
METILRRNASRINLQQPRKFAARIPQESKERLVAPIAGFTSAAIEISTVWPFEYLKTQLQLNKNNSSFSVAAHLRERGFGIYRGLAPLLVGAPLQGLLRFTTLDYFNAKLKDPVTGKISVLSGLTAGLAAGVLESCLVVTPMETVKTKLIHSNKGIRYIIEKQGVVGLYKGLGATIAKSASNQGLRFIIFNQYKNVLLENPQNEKLSATQALFGGMLAGFLGALGNTPIDTIKSRMQSMDAHKYKNTFDCARTMVREEGALSLYKGLIPRLGRVLPGQGIIFCCYESISASLRAHI